MNKYPTTFAVYRIAWLRAKQRQDRWHEEIQQCAADLLMAKNWFKYQQNMWLQKAENAKQSNDNGCACYAYRKANMWRIFYSNAAAYNPCIDQYYWQKR